jgi:hypothetical protein
MRLQVLTIFFVFFFLERFCMFFFVSSREGVWSCGVLVRCWDASRREGISQVKSSQVALVSRGARLYGFFVLFVQGDERGREEGSTKMRIRTTYLFPFVLLVEVGGLSVGNTISILFLSECLLAAFRMAIYVFCCALLCWGLF